MELANLAQPARPRRDHADPATRAAGRRGRRRGRCRVGLCQLPGPGAHYWSPLPAGRRLDAGIRMVLAAVLGWLVASLIGHTAYVVAFGTTIVTAQDFAPLLSASVAAIV